MASYKTRTVAPPAATSLKTRSTSSSSNVVVLELVDGAVQREALAVSAAQEGLERFH
jgi:hypothetical protein